MLKIKKVLIMELLVDPISNYPKKHYKIANKILCGEGRYVTLIVATIRDSRWFGPKRFRPTQY